MFDGSHNSLMNVSLIADTETPSATFVIVGIAAGLAVSLVLLLLLRPLIRRYYRWVRGPHSSRTNILMPGVLILWGGGLWALTVAKGTYDNIPAMIAGTVLSLAGVFLVIKALTRRA
jgi:hypothetical protein